MADEHDLGFAILNVTAKQTLTDFLKSRRQGLSPYTLEYYKTCLTPFLMFYEVKPDAINKLLANLNCNQGGKLAYYRAIRAFCNWLYRSGHIRGNPIKRVEPPKPPKAILPILTSEQVEYLIDFVSDVRDKAIISLFDDNGMRLTELSRIQSNISLL